MPGPGRYKTNTHYRPGFVERTKRAVRDALHWMKWTLITLAIGAVGGILGYINSDAIGEWGKDKLSEHFSGKAEVSQTQKSLSVETTVKIPSTVPVLPPEPPMTEEEKLSARDGVPYIISPPPTPKITTERAPALKPAPQPPSGFSLKKFYNAWTKSSLIAKIEQHTQNDKITAEDLINLIGNESKFNTKAHSISNAKGLGQHVPDSQLGDMYAYKHVLPAYAARLAEGITRKGKTYDFTKEADRKAIWKAIEDPDVSIPLTREHFRADLIAITEELPAKLDEDIKELKKLGAEKNKYRIKEIERYRDQPRTPAEGYLAYVAGKRDAIEILRAYADPENKKKLVKHFADPRTIVSNPNIFYNPGGVYDVRGEKVYRRGPLRTVEETVLHAIEIMGNRPLPKNLSRPSATAVAPNPDNTRHLT